MLCKQEKWHYEPARRLCQWHCAALESHMKTHRARKNPDTFRLTPALPDADSCLNMSSSRCSEPPKGTCCIMRLLKTSVHLTLSTLSKGSVPCRLAAWARQAAKRGQRKGAKNWCCQWRHRGQLNETNLALGPPAVPVRKSCRRA